MSETVCVVARFVGRPAMIDELIAVLTGLVEPTRRETGCRRYDLLQSTTDPTLLTFVEEWDSDADLDRHLASDHLQAALPRVVELCAEGPDIQRFAQIA